MEGSPSQQWLAAMFAEHRGRLLALAERRLKPVLLRRMSAEDVVQDAYAAAAKRLDYLANNEDVPLYYKLRTILMQTIVDAERRHLGAEARDAYRESTGDDADAMLAGIPAEVTTPASRVDRSERHALLRRAIAMLPPNDRAILVLRHFDGLSNSDCAAALGIEPKAASIRHVRALERLQKTLETMSCFCEDGRQTP